MAAATETLRTWGDLVAVRVALQPNVEWVAENHSNDQGESVVWKEVRESLKRSSDHLAKRIGLESLLDTIRAEDEKIDILGSELLKADQDLQKEFKGFTPRLSRHLLWLKETERKEKISFLELDKALQTTSRCAMHVLEEEKKNVDQDRVTFSVLNNGFTKQLQAGLLNDYDRVVIKNNLIAVDDEGIEVKVYRDSVFYTTCLKKAVTGVFSKFAKDRVKIDEEIIRLGEITKRIKQEQRAKRIRSDQRGTKGRKQRIGEKIDKLDGFMTAVPRSVPRHILPGGITREFQDELMDSLFKY